MLGLKELKSCGWTCVKRDRAGSEAVLDLDLFFMSYLRPVVLLASLDPELIIQRPKADKGKGRAAGERTRDWTPLVRREQEMARLAQRHPTPQSAASRQTELHLVPPPAWNNSNYIQTIQPPRQSRKRQAKARDTTVKQEEQDLYIA
jgi:hypothetical protein